MSAKLKKLFIFLFLANIFCLHAKSVPTLQSRVNDYANVISQSDKSQLESLLYSLENSTGIQIAVLTIDSLEGEDLEDYSMKVAETWKITVTPSMNNTEDAFVAYCPRPYNPV